MHRKSRVSPLCRRPFRRYWQIVDRRRRHRKEIHSSYQRNRHIDIVNYYWKNTRHRVRIGKGRVRVTDRIPGVSQNRPPDTSGNVIHVLHLPDGPPSYHKALLLSHSSLSRYVGTTSPVSTLGLSVRTDCQTPL